MKWFKTSSFFKSLVLISCIIGILPLLLLGYLSYSKSATIVQEEVIKGNRLILQQNKEQVESQLKTIDTLTTLSIGGPVTTNAVSMSTVLDLPYHYDHIKLFDSLVYKLVEIQIFELGIHDVHLISFKKNWLVKGGVVYPMEDREFDNKQDLSLHQLKQTLESYRNDKIRSYWLLTKDEDSKFVLKLIKHIPLHSVDPYGLVTVNLPVTEISKWLAEAEQLGNVMVLDAEGVIISHSDIDRIGDNVSDVPLYQHLLTEASHEGYYTTNIDKEEYAIIYNRSKYNNWIYVAMMPLDNLIEKSNIIKGYTIISIAFIILLIVITSIVVSLRLTSPIRTLYRFVRSDTDQLFGNELQFIGEKVKQIVHSQSEMIEEIERMNKLAGMYFVIKLLQGDIKAEDLEENLERYGYPIDWDEWCLIAIQIDTLDGTQYTENDRNLLMYAILNIVEEIIPINMRLTPVIKNESLFLFMGLPSNIKPLKVQVFNHAEKILNNVKKFLKLKISIGISRNYSNFSRGSDAYEEALDALAYRVRLDEGSILFIDEVQLEKQEKLRYPKELEFRILEAIRQVNEPQAKEGLDQIISYFFDKHISQYDYQVFLGRLFNNMIGIVQNFGYSVDEVFNKDLFQLDVLYRMRTSESVKHYLEQQVLLPILMWVKERHRNQEVNISEEIIDTIHQHYDKDLSIEFFANRLNFHPSYISRVFKKEIGVSFTEYLTQYRINIAKNWLKDTDMKISTIAEKLGYSTASNFNRNFKKHVKVTPSQYREKFK